MERLNEKELTELQNLNTEFTKLKITLGDLEIQKSSIISEIAAIKMKFAQNEKKLIDKWIFWILNCGNFIVNKKYMVDIAADGLKFDRKLLSVDAIVFSYLWLENSFEIKILNDFYHHHRKRNDSVSFTESEDSVNAIKYFIDKVLDF